MRKIFFTIILFLSLISYSQSYSLIEKAEKRIEKKEYSKALKLLKRAESADYGFCGNAKIEALFKITELRFQIFKETNDIDGMKMFLDNIDPFFEFTNSYSIERLKLALSRYNKTDIDNSILNVLKTINRLDNFDYGGLILIKIDDSYSIKLFFNNSEIWNLEEKEKLTYNEALLKYYKNSDYYKLLNIP